MVKWGCNYLIEGIITGKRRKWLLTTIILLYLYFFIPRIDRSGAYCFTGVCRFVCLSVLFVSVRQFVCPSVFSTENLTCELNIFLYFHTIQVTMLIFGMQVAFDNTQLVRVMSSRSRSNIKVHLPRITTGR